MFSLLVYEDINNDVFLLNNNTSLASTVNAKFSKNFLILTELFKFSEKIWQNILYKFKSHIDVWKNIGSKLFLLFSNSVFLWLKTLSLHDSSNLSILWTNIYTFAFEENSDKAFMQLIYIKLYIII